VAAATAICHAADDATDTPSPTQPNHSDCELCPLCLTSANYAVFLRAEAPSLPAPRVLPHLTAGTPPQATAPPVHQRSTAQPRAPPILA